MKKIFKLAVIMVLAEVAVSCNGGVHPPPLPPKQPDTAKDTSQSQTLPVKPVVDTSKQQPSMAKKAPSVK